MSLLGVITLSLSGVIFDTLTLTMGGVTGINFELEFDICLAYLGRALKKDQQYIFISTNTLFAVYFSGLRIGRMEWLVTM